MKFNLLKTRRGKLANVTRLKINLNYKDLKYNKNFIQNSDCYEKINSRFKKFEDYLKYYTENKINIVFLVVNIVLILAVLRIVYSMVYSACRFVWFGVRFIFHIGKFVVWSMPREFVGLIVNSSKKKND